MHISWNEETIHSTEINDTSYELPSWFSLGIFFKINENGLTKKLWRVFLRIRQKKKFLEKKFQNGRLKTSAFFKIANSQNFFVKISWISPWVSRIDWCGGHWWGSTYMVVRLSNISSKIGKKCIFCVFRLFLSLYRTASQPYKLSHTNTLCIN